VSDGLEKWLQMAGLGDRITQFRSAQIDLEQLLKLTSHQLGILGLSPDEQVRFTLAAAGSRALPAISPPPELRPITATYIDLVDSTKISVRLDHEDFLETLSQYYEACASR
jgi:class 3 adenylate cyclase